jgi:hypothetical protein
MAMPMSRRQVLRGSMAGLAAVPFTTLGAEAIEEKAAPACAPGVDKCSWTLTKPKAVARKEFQQFILHELAPACGKLVPEPSEIKIILQESGAFSNASVKMADGEKPIDAVLEIATSCSYSALSGVNAYLSSHCDYVQGWRIRSDLIYDGSTAAPLGARSALPSVLAFIRRLDGTTPEHFERNWSLHAEQAKREGGGAQGRYEQNRVVEAITPTAWVVNGYSQLYMRNFIPSIGLRAPAPKGEDSFAEWPPLIVQGYAYRVL